MDNTAVVFIASLIEVFDFCCVLSILRRKYWCGVKIGIMSILLAAITTLLDLVQIDMNLGINVVCLTAILCIMYRMKLLEAFFDVIGGAMIFQVLQMIVVFSWGLIKGTPPTSELDIIGLVVVDTFMVLLLLKITWDKTGFQEYYHKYQKALKLVFVNFLFAEIIYTAIWNGNNYQFGENKVELVILICIIFVTNVILAWKMIQSERREKELLYQRNLTEVKENFLEKMVAEQHDFAKHLQAIKSVAEAGGDNTSKMIVEYINDLSRYRREDVGGSHYVGEGVLSAFLAAKDVEARKRGIHFSCLVKQPLPEYPCGQSELIGVVGNLIDNAFDAIEGMEIAKKKVYFEIGEDSSHIFIKTINSIPDNFTLEEMQMTEKGFSTKDGECRGYGLYNIKCIVERNGGKLEIQMNRDVIIIRALF